MTMEKKSQVAKALTVAVALTILSPLLQEFGKILFVFLGMSVFQWHIP
jgi:hypothetical protein